MKITDQMLTSGLMRDLDSLKDRMAVSTERLSSGSKINRPSDDPYQASRAMDLKTEIAGAQQHQRNASEATGWLDATDTALSGMSDLMQRARELMVRGANGTNDSSAREAIATELDSITSSLKAQSSATYAGRYVMAGTATNVKPYSDTDDAYHGDQGAIARSVGPGVSIQVNVNASEVLGDGSANDGKLLSTLRAASADLRSGSTTSLKDLRETQLTAMDTSTDTLNKMRAVVGSTTNRVESATSSLTAMEETATKLLSNVADTDVAQTIMDLTSQRTAYESALKAGASIIQPSLLDFLR